MIEATSLSILITIRRVTTELAQVRVPVTDKIVAELSGAGKPDALMGDAIRLGAEPEVKWVLEEEPTIEVHPIQRPPF